MTQWTRLNGILVEGYRVASGPSADYPHGALDRQRPIFKLRGLDLDTYFNGTLNIDTQPYVFMLKQPRLWLIELNRDWKNVLIHWLHGWTSARPQDCFARSTIYITQSATEYTEFSEFLSHFLCGLCGGFLKQIYLSSRFGV